MGRGILGLAAFFLVTGVAFTLMAPGGLGEPTIALGVIVALAALFPENWIAGLANKMWRWIATVLLVLGGIVTILDWGLYLGKFWDVVSVVLFFGGFAVLLLHALAYWHVESAEDTDLDDPDDSDEAIEVSTRREAK